MSLALTINAMVAAGCSAAQLAAVVAAHESANATSVENRRAAKRAGNADRQRRHRERNLRNAVTERDDACHGVTTPVTASNAVTERDEPSAPAFSTGEELSILTPEKPTVSAPDAQPVTRQQKTTPEAELATVVGHDVAAEVVDHRRRMRRPLTPQAAARMARQFEATGKPQEAARMMIDRGWQGFKLEWFQNAQTPPARAGPANGRKPQTNPQMDVILDSLSDNRKYSRDAF